MTTEAALLNLVADIRAAVGDKEVRLMQPELVAHCRNLRETQDRLSDWRQLDWTELRARIPGMSARECNAILKALALIDGPVKPDATW
jgi:hypothetical protein